MKKYPASVPIRPFMLKALRDPEDAAAYLEVVIEDNEEFYIKKALRDIADAQGGLAKLAKKAKMNRVSLYRMLSDKGNPELSSLIKVIDALGMRLSVVPVTPPKATKAPKRARKGPLTTKRPIRKLTATRTKAVSR